MSLDSEKQRKLEDFVNNEVLINETMLVDELLKEGKFQYEDIENLQIWVCPECGGGMEEHEHSGPDSFNFICTYCNHKQDEEPELERQTIYEWWRVSDWLITQLSAKGELILHTVYGDYWGRAATGQAIKLDGVIEEIYDETRRRALS